jgi:membrane protein DedA with SNARE-associated domain
MLEFIARFGPLAVFLLMIAESACVPIPSEVIMLGAGAATAVALTGGPGQLVAVIVAGALGNLVGSYLPYAVGRYAGQPAVRRWGRYVHLTDGHVAAAHRWFSRYGSASVFFGRMLPVVRTFISLPAGFAAMPAVRFLVYTLAGCLAWSAALGVAGYEIGANWHGIAHAFHDAAYGVVGGIVVVALAGAALAYRRLRRTRGCRSGRHARGSSLPIAKDEQP